MRRWRAAAPATRRALAPVLLAGTADRLPARAQPARRRHRLPRRRRRERRRRAEHDRDGLGPVRVPDRPAALASVTRGRRERARRPPGRGRPPPGPARRDRRDARRSLAVARLLGGGPGPVRRRRGAPGRAARPGPEHDVHAGRARRSPGGDDLPRRLPRGRARAGRDRRGSGQPRARERAPQRRAARPGRGAARLARADRRGRRRGAAAARARPPRRRPAAARVAGDQPPARLEEARQRPRRGARRSSTRRPRSSARRPRTCASSPAGCTPRCSAIAACARRSRRSRAAPRCRSSWRRRRSTACRRRSSPPPTSSSPRRSRTSPGTPTPRTPRSTISRRNGEVEVEIRDDGVGGANPDTGSGLRGLSDRVAALNGRLEVVEPAGGRHPRSGR